MSLDTIKIIYIKKDSNYSNHDKLIRIAFKILDQISWRSDLGGLLINGMFSHLAVQLSLIPLIFLSDNKLYVSVSQI